MAPKRTSAFLLLLATVLSSGSIQSAPSIEPGETYQFTVADAGMRVCRAKDFFLEEGLLDCLGPPIGNWIVSLAGVLPGGTPPWQKSFLGETLFLDTKSQPQKNMVSTAFSLSGLTLDQLKLGIPHVAMAGVYNDFEIADPEGTNHVVDVQIAVAYAWEALIHVIGNYDIEVGVSLEVEDITDDPANPIPVGTLDLVNKSRQGDQPVGLELNVGSSDYDGNDESASFLLKLNRGRTYRIWFKAQTASAPNVLLISAFDAGVRARWTDLSVTVDEDDDGVADLLIAHDQDIKQELVVVKGELEDVRAELSRQKALLNEILVLLKTPQGRRPDWNRTRIELFRR